MKSTWLKLGIPQVNGNYEEAVRTLITPKYLQTVGQILTAWPAEETTDVTTRKALDSAQSASLYIQYPISFIASMEMRPTLAVAFPSDRIYIK